MTVAAASRWARGAVPATLVSCRSSGRRSSCGRSPSPASRSGGRALPGPGTVAALAAVETAMRRLDARRFALLAAIAGIDAALRLVW